MPQLLKDETTRIVDAGIEAVIASILARNEKMNRADVLRMLTQRVMRKATRHPQLDYIPGKSMSDAALAPA